jgi:hypothetical protein
LLLAVVSGAFLLQVFMRYVVNRPLEGSLEVACSRTSGSYSWSLGFLLDCDRPALGSRAWLPA